MDALTPVLVGCGDITDMGTPAERARSPYELIAEAARLAIADTSAHGLSAAIDTVAMVRMFAETSPRFATRLGKSANPPGSIAQRLGIRAKRQIYTWGGGNMPQYLVNMLAESIARGETQAALIAGGEALRTQHGAERTAPPGCWDEDPGGVPEMVGDPRRGWSDLEDSYNMRAAINFYPLIENAIRAGRGASVEDHMRSMGRLFAAFSDVAAANPLATRRERYTAERLATVDDDNRWIGFPYTRLMMANAFIDQAAALVITSAGKARELGIPESKWVYLHGCADAHDHWYLSERPDLSRSPAIAAASRQALSMAGKALDEIDLFDLYSCFPSAVEIACNEMGLSESDPRGLTVTGGLSYFGGPGNNYVTHSIAEMMRRLRSSPDKFGMVTANGNYITKHSFGIYSTRAPGKPWQRTPPAVLQDQLDVLPKARIAVAPSGPATIETFTVMHGKRGPEFSIVFGRLERTGERFIARTSDKRDVLLALQDRESLGRRGIVETVDGLNCFRLTG